MQKDQASVAGLDGNTGWPSFASAHEPGPNDGLRFTDTESQNSGGGGEQACSRTLFMAFETLYVEEQR